LSFGDSNRVIWAQIRTTATLRGHFNSILQGSDMTKEAYNAPEMVALGSFETITQGGSSTGTLDSQFPVGTPSQANVFS